MRINENDRPVIGITARQTPSINGLPAVQILHAYVKAIHDGGGTAVLIPPDLPKDGLKSLLKRLDGVLFSGGADIGINYFGGEPHQSVVVESDRDILELPLLLASIEADIPILGICRGLQVMNVALGGTLYTHIIDQYPNALQHDTPDDLPRTHLSHAVEIHSNTHLHKIIKTSHLQVNSLHHQGIKDLAPKLIASARASDGLVEGVEIPEHKFMIGVQWHPEWMTSSAEMQSLFKAFIEAALETS